MATGWAGDSAVQEQIESTVNDAIAKARMNMPSGKSLQYCAECGEAIPLARQNAIPGVRLCIICQQESDNITRLGLAKRRVMR